LMTYLGLVLQRALERSFRLTDQLSVYAAVLVPAALALWGPAMPEALGGYAAVAIVTLVSCLAVLRLLSAPYAVWREQAKEIDDLRKELAKPEQIERHRLAEHLADVRAKLSNELAEISQAAMGHDQKGGTVSSSRAEKLINQMAYEEPLASMCREYLHHCRVI